MAFPSNEQSPEIVNALNYAAGVVTYYGSVATVDLATQH